MGRIDRAFGRRTNRQQPSTRPRPVACCQPFGTEALNGTNIADARRVLDQLPQEDALVGVARALVEDDMPRALSRLE